MGQGVRLGRAPRRVRGHDKLVANVMGGIQTNDRRQAFVEAVDDMIFEPSKVIDIFIGEFRTQ